MALKPQEQLESEAKEDEETYDKFKCWCHESPGLQVCFMGPLLPPSILLKWGVGIQGGCWGTHNYLALVSVSIPPGSWGNGVSFHSDMVVATPWLV